VIDRVDVRAQLLDQILTAAIIPVGAKLWVLPAKPSP
jgi:hypothetical protein